MSVFKNQWAYFILFCLLTLTGSGMSQTISSDNNTYRNEGVELDQFGRVIYSSQQGRIVYESNPIIEDESIIIDKFAHRICEYNHSAFQGPLIITAFDF